MHWELVVDGTGKDASCGMEMGGWVGIEAEFGCCIVLYGSGICTMPISGNKYLEIRGYCYKITQPV